MFRKVYLFSLKITCATQQTENDHYRCYAYSFYAIHRRGVLGAVFLQKLVTSPACQHTEISNAKATFTRYRFRPVVRGPFHIRVLMSCGIVAVPMPALVNYVFPPATGRQASWQVSADARARVLVGHVAD